MDKIIIINDLFQVSIDYLIKNQDNDPLIQENTTQKYFMNKTRIEDYIQFKKRLSLRIALGTSAIILSMNLPIYFYKTQYQMLSTAIFLLVNRFSVMIFYYNRMKC